MTLPGLLTPFRALVAHRLPTPFPGPKAGATKADLEKAMKGQILAQAELIGRYKR
jgi:phosphatidylethanolamine-binding protein (PEBP) family uncharacterized protein